MATIGPIDNNQLLSTTNNVQFATLGIGVAPATADVKISAGNRIGAWITGANVSSGSDADGLFIDTSFQPSANIGNAASIGLYPTMAPPGGVTITTGYGLYIASGTFAGAGAVTTGYGLFVTAPTIATTNITAQLDNIRLDSNIIQATNANGTLTVQSAGVGTLSLGTNATAHSTVLGSTTASATTTVQAPSGGVILTGVQGVAVANKNYVTINTVTGGIGSDAGPGSSITITGDSGGGLTGSSFTFTGGSTGLTFAGAGSTETLGGTLAIANGGTNATSMSTSTGIVKYDGTRLVTSSTAKIDSSNRQTNTSQPCFLATSAGASNVTGDGTSFVVGSSGTAWTVVFDQNSNFNTNGTFTAPVTGKYHFDVNIELLDIGVGHTSVYIIGTATSRSLVSGYCNPGVQAAGGNYMIMFNGNIDMTATDTITFAVVVGGGTKTVDVNSSASNTWISGYLIC